MPEQKRSTGEVTEHLRRWGDGSISAFDELMPRVYEQLSALARQRLRRERPGQTLDTSGLVHEAYLKLRDANPIDWQDRAHFFAVASRAMRRILIDRAKSRNSAKRGGRESPITLDNERMGDMLAAPDVDPDALLALDEALTRLEQESPRQARAVELRYFGDLSLSEVGEALGISAPTAMRDLRFAQAWLARALGVAGAG
jgi:RNA polymerase sigma factor (TIGR02999 family)